MRPLVILAAAIFAASGCVTQPVPTHSALPTDQPLDVRLYFTEPTTVKYFVSEPAHIAVFEVMAPSDGRAFLLYRTTSGPSKPGLNTVPSGRERLGNAHYTPIPKRATVTSPPERYLYIVASKTPLRLDFDNADLFRDYVRQRWSFRSNLIGETLEQLNRIVGVRDDGEWSADLFVI